MTDFLPAKDIISNFRSCYGSWDETFECFSTGNCAEVIRLLREDLEAGIPIFSSVALEDDLVYNGTHRVVASFLHGPETLVPVSFDDSGFLDEHIWQFNFSAVSPSSWAQDDALDVLAELRSFVTDGVWVEVVSSGVCNEIYNVSFYVPPGGSPDAVFQEYARRLASDSVIIDLISKASNPFGK